MNDEMKETKFIEIIRVLTIVIILFFSLGIIMSFAFYLSFPYCHTTMKIDNEFFVDENNKKIRFLAFCN